MKRRSIALLLSVSLVLVGILSSFGAAALAASSDVIKIAYIGALTGEGTLLAEYEFNGIELAVEEINAAGGVNGAKLELIKEDTGGTNSGAVLATQKVSRMDDVVAIIGYRRSPHFMAASKYVEEAKIPVMTFGTALQITREGNPYVFRDRPHDGIVTGIAVKFAVENLGSQKLAILYDTDVYGIGGLENATEHLKNLYDLDFVSAQGYQTGAKDWTPQLLNIKQSGAEVIIGWGTNTQENAVILRQIRQMGLDVKVVGAPTYSSTALIDIAGEYAEGLYTITDWSVSLDDEKSLKFVADFVAKYGFEPDYASSSGYDGLYILADAIARAGTDREAITEAIRSTKDLVGVQASYTFDEFGDGNHTMCITQVKDGLFEVLERVTLN